MIELKVSDAKQRDVARGIGRIDENAMKKLGVSSGDAIEIIGGKSTAAIAWPAYQEDRDKGIIRIDGVIRKNAGTDLNALVKVRPAEAKDASRITLEPVDMHMSPDKDFTAFVKNRQMERVFVEGDTTLVMVLGHPVLLTTTETIPDGIVRMTYSTDLVVKGEPVEKALAKVSKLSPRRLSVKGFALGKRDNTVMTRLSDEDLKQIDMLVGIGLFDSRSEAVAYLTHEGIVAKREMFKELSSKFEQINKIRDEAKALLGTSAPISNVKECQECGKENPPENKFCSSCGQELQ